MRAIDIHAHVPREPGLEEIGIEQGLRAMFRMRESPPDPAGMAETYRDLDVLAVIFSVDSQTATGDVPDSNDYVAEIAAWHPEQFIGFASVDPHKGEWAVKELERSVKELGLKGLKLHPIHQAFFPNDDAFRPLFDMCEQLKAPVLIHSGYAAAGAGTPGGGGFRLKYARPVPYIDDLAADHPDLTIIMAHPAWPWVDEQVAVALHKPNVYIDLSGWAPRYIPRELIREANTRLQDKVLFGSDYPYMPPSRWLQEFEELEMRDGPRQKILLDNAKRVLGL